MYEERQQNSDSLRCPKCGEEMNVGYAWIRSSHHAWLDWGTAKPTKSSWSFSWSLHPNKGEANLMKLTLFQGPPRNYRKAHRCAKCGIVVIEHERPPQ